MPVEGDHDRAYASAQRRCILTHLCDQRAMPGVHTVKLADRDDCLLPGNRRVAGSASWSQHSYGRAVDINPVQNPYVAGSTVSPPAGRAYLDRGNVRTGMIVQGDWVVRAFGIVGWGWGGAWSSAKDYQHFSSTGR